MIMIMIILIIITQLELDFRHSLGYEKWLVIKPRLTCKIWINIVRKNSH